MAQHPFLENLLNGQAVEWKPLGEVGKFIRGKRFVKTDIIEFGTPCIHYGEMYTHYDIWADKTRSYISPELAKNLRFARKNDVIIVSAGETVEDIGKGVAWLGEEPVVIHDACFVFRSEINPKYVSYFLRTKSFHDQIKKHISYGKIASINSQGLSKAIIPIPPLSVQTEIVRKLDLMTSLIDELKNELNLRQKQYQFYLNKFLTSDFETVQSLATASDSGRQRATASDSKTVAWKTLGEITKYEQPTKYIV